jgi:two-component system phosphate regulon sensor histidine kinase PhoR
LDNTTNYINLAELDALRLELEETRARLEEANDTLDAIRAGEVDALVVKENDSHQLYTLKSADQTYRIFIEQMTESVVTLNFENNILYCNTRFAEMVQQPLEKVIGQPLCKFIANDHWDSCDTLIQKAWISNARGELSLISHTGRHIPMLLSCKRLDLEESMSMSIILTDLSSQKEAQELLLQKNAQLEEAEKMTRYLNSNLEALVQERTRELEKTIEEKIQIGEELRHNQERLTKILETMAEGVTIMDADGDIIYANPMAQKILELELQALPAPIYKTAAQTVTIDGSPLEKKDHPAYISMTTGKPVYDTEIGIAVPGKERFYILVNAAPIFDKDNNITGSIGTFMDVTRRRIAIQQKDDFIGVASHELKTPITVLKTSIQLLDRLKNNPMHNMLPVLIEQANKGMKKLGYLVEDLLDVSRLKEGQLALNKKNFTIAEMLQDSIAHLHMEKRNAVIIKGDTQLQLHADPNRIEQVVVNFINNAVKYAPASREIVISVVKLENDIRISVMDEGPGIDKTKQQHLFDRYYRTDYSGEQYSGLGLGLYISAEIVKKHNGRIGVESEPGKGSTFWFTLPLQ